MNLSQSIVIKNEFTNWSYPGHGATPGNFVLRYVARHGATEAMLPVQQANLQQFVLRYLNRRQATEQSLMFDEEPQTLQTALQNDPLAGRAFGNQGDAYTGDELRQTARQIQHLWDTGHTVQKLVVSFKTDYLKQRGILPADFVMAHRGDAVGQVDQLKLRHALNTGMERYTQTAGYQDPLWTGSVQVDTLHVHAHIVCVDQGAVETSQRLLPDGTERGKITEQQRQVLRRSINHDLQEMQPLYQWHQQVDLDRQNVISHVDELLDQRALMSGQLQTVVAALPQDRHLWSMNSRARVMQRPNQLMMQYLDTFVDQHYDALGFDQVEETLRHYSEVKQAIDGGDPQDYYQRGQQQLYQRMGNRIYHQLAQQPAQDLQVTTPFLQSSAQDTDEIVQQLRHQTVAPSDDDLLLYTYRLGSYGQRARYHTQEVDDYQQAMNAYQQQAAQQQVQRASWGLYHHLQMERRYHMEALDKYRYFERGWLQVDDQQWQALSQQQAPLQQMHDRLVMTGVQEGVLLQPDMQQRLAEQYRDLLYDQQAQPWLQDHQLQTSLTGALAGKPLSLMARQALIDYGRQHVAYHDLSQLLSQQQVDVQFDQQFQQYTNQVAAFTAYGFQNGLLNAQQVTEPFDYLRPHYPVTSNQVLTVPTLQAPTQHLTNDYFNQVKSVDLHQLQFDFGINQTITLSSLSQRYFQRMTRQRQQAVQDATQYLTSSHQNSQVLAGAQHDIQLAMQVSQEVQRSHQLHCGTAGWQLSPLESPRNLKSFTSGQTQRLVHEDLTVERQVVQEATYQLQREIQHDLELDL